MTNKCLKEIKDVMTTGVNYQCTDSRVHHHKNEREQDKALESCLKKNDPKIQEKRDEYLQKKNPAKILECIKSLLK